MGTVSLDQLELRKFQFAVTRADAIADYSNLEQAWCGCLAHFGGMTDLVAGTIFFKVTASRARSEILDKLKKNKVGNLFPSFWNNAISEGGKLDEERNKIIHWMVSMSIYLRTTDNQSFYDVVLRSPNYWAWEEDTQEIEISAMNLFGAKCQFLWVSLNKFLALDQKKLEGAEADAWREIFREPHTYPPPPDHPLYRSAIERERRPPPSRESPGAEEGRPV
jgi:hypothetical protein